MMRMLDSGVWALIILMAGTSITLEAQETALWYLGTYTRDILVWDEASEQVVDRIEMGHHTPADIVVNEGKDRIYVRDGTALYMELVDLKTKEVVDEFTLSQGNVTVRINGFAPHPSDEKAVIFAKRYTKLRDRYVVEGPFLLEYDLTNKTVTDTIPWPDDQERESIRFQYSPDGEILYMFAEDIIALDGSSYEEVDRWQISTPIESGVGRSRFGTAPQPYDEEGVASSLFRMTDPVQNRRLMGIAKVRLSEKKVEFFTLGEARPVRNFTLAPDGKKAYGLLEQGNIAEYEFWEFDLVNQRVSKRVPFAGRPRMTLGVSADGEHLFIYNAGNTIDVYDAETFDYIKQIVFDEDTTFEVMIPETGNFTP